MIEEGRVKGWLLEFFAVLVLLVRFQMGRMGRSH